MKQSLASDHWLGELDWGVREKWYKSSVPVPGPLPSVLPIPLDGDMNGCWASSSGA